LRRSGTVKREESTPEGGEEKEGGWNDYVTMTRVDFKFLALGLRATARKEALSRLIVADRPPKASSQARRGREDKGGGKDPFA
jgi:hypothetical protein